MKKLVVDAGVVLRLLSEPLAVRSGIQLLAPTLLRSQVLSLLHEAVRGGKVPPEVGRDRLERLSKLPIRLLGDADLRRTAWKIADQLGRASTYDAEYLALTRLQADAFVTLDPKLARAAREVVPVASFDALVTGARLPAPSGASGSRP